MRKTGKRARSLTPNACTIVRMPNNSNAKGSTAYKLDRGEGVRIHRPNRPRRGSRTPLSILFDECPGAQSVDEYAELISPAWQKSLDATFEVCKLCADADQNLDDAKKKELIARLPFDRTRFVKLAKIGRDQRLQDPQIRPLLPHHHTTLYQLAGLNDHELAAAVEAKIVRPNMKRAELTDWVKNSPRTWVGA